MKIKKQHFRTFWNRRFLLYELIKKGIKLKYRRSYLGILWSLLEPILTTIVLTIVFGTLFGNRSRDFPLYILCGRLLYSFFSLGTKTASKSIRANASMIRKVYVPKYLYPLSSVLYNYIIFLISLIVMIPLAIYCRVSLTWHIFEALIPLVTLLVMTYGVGMLLATINVFFRDMEYLWEVILMLIMYSSAIFYYPERLMKSGYAWILRLNPLYCVIESFRDAMFGNAMDLYRVAYAGIFSVASLVIGMAVFYWKQDEFILQI